MHGRYEEAAEIYKPQSAADLQAALGLAACQEAQGKTDEAVKTLNPLAEKHADIQAQLARLAFERGDYNESRHRVDATLKLAAEHPLGLYIKAELARTSGSIEEAERLPSPDRVLQQSQRQVPRRVRWIGRAAAEYARWNRLSDQFDFLVNDLYPSAVKLDADYWPASSRRDGCSWRSTIGRTPPKSSKRPWKSIPAQAKVHASMAELAMEDFHLEQAEASLRRARGNQSSSARCLVDEGRHRLAKRRCGRIATSTPRKTIAAQFAR